MTSTIPGTKTIAQTSKSTNPLEKKKSFYMYLNMTGFNNLITAVPSTTIKRVQCIIK